MASIWVKAFDNIYPDKKEAELRNRISFLIVAIFSLFSMLVGVNAARGQELDRDLVISLPDVCSGRVMVSLQIPDDRRITKVEFYVNGIYFNI